MFSSSSHKREQNGCFEKKKKCFLLTRATVTVKQHLRHLHRDGTFPLIIYSFNTFIECKLFVRFHSRVWSAPMNKGDKKHLPFWSFLVEGDRQEHMKKLKISYRNEYQEENKWTRECLGRAAASDRVVREAFLSKMMIFELRPEWWAKANLGRFGRQNIPYRRNGMCKGHGAEVSLVWPKIRHKVMMPWYLSEQVEGWERMRPDM